MKTIVICSGGLDSVTLAHRISNQHELLGLLSFDYGQRHKKKSLKAPRFVPSGLASAIKSLTFNISGKASPVPR